MAAAAGLTIGILVAFLPARSYCPPLEGHFPTFLLPMLGAFSAAVATEFYPRFPSRHSTANLPFTLFFIAAYAWLVLSLTVLVFFLSFEQGWLALRSLGLFYISLTIPPTALLPVFGLVLGALLRREGGSGIGFLGPLIGGLVGLIFQLDICLWISFGAG